MLTLFRMKDRKMAPYLRLRPKNTRLYSKEKQKDGSTLLPFCNFGSTVGPPVATASTFRLKV